MNFDTYQQQAKAFAIYDDPIYPILGLVSEAGEVAGKVKKWIRDGGDPTELHDNLAKELGDVLWYISAIASDMNYTLADIAQINLNKLTIRAARGTIQGSGDNR